MKPGDLVRCSGPFYDAPIDHHDMQAAVRHYMGFMTTLELGVVVDMTQVGNTTLFWCQVLTGGRTVWLAGSGIRAA